MSDFKPETRALLELGRGGDEPTDHEVLQNRRSLVSKLGGAAFGAGALLSATSKASAASASFFSTKLLMVCGAVVLGGSAALGAVYLESTPAPAQVTTNDRLPERAAIVKREPSAPPPSTSAAQSAVPDDVRTAKAQPVPARATTSARSLAARSIQEEFELIRAAQKHLHRNEPQAALQLLNEHARRFPGGALSEEREASKVFALCRMGNTSAARAQAKRFVLRAPKSPFVDRVREACGSGSQ